MCVCNRGHDRHGSRSTHWRRRYEEDWKANTIFNSLSMFSTKPTSSFPKTPCPAIPVWLPLPLTPYTSSSHTNLAAAIIAAITEDAPFDRPIVHQPHIITHVPQNRARKHDDRAEKSMQRRRILHLIISEQCTPYQPIFIINTHAVR